MWRWTSAGALLGLCWCAGAAAQTDSGSALEISVRGLRSDDGDLLAQLFDSSEGFPRDAERALRRQRTAIREGSARVVFEDVVPGVYAVAVCHDENRSGDCDTSFLGIPSEGVGVSNDALRRFGPPRFEDASSRLVGPVQRLVIHVQYR